ncbi:MAG TPA: carboxymuconolactone decarboxylase family protein [Actinomycetota bacterium]|nr:carboxymuconolactone decarboxylase family protein [Actinomycetota bacterium]
MSDGDRPGVSPGFAAFRSDAPAHHKAWMDAASGLHAASVLDPKTEALAYLAVLAAVRMETGVPFHVKEAKRAGASRDEVISAILIGLPAVGHGLVQTLPAALAAYDGD